MTSITPQQFHDSEGTADWRFLFSGVTACFRVDSLGQAIEFAGRVGSAVTGLGRVPDLDLRADSVTVRAFPGVDGPVAADIELARRVSAAAADLGLAADPQSVQHIQLAIDATDYAAIREFWAAVLGYRLLGEEDAVDPKRIGPPIWFQESPELRTGRNRIHVDVSVPHDVAESRIAAALAAGGRMVEDRFAPAGWTLADPEGNEVDIATWQGRA